MVLKSETIYKSFCRERSIKYSLEKRKCGCCVRVHRNISRQKFCWETYQRWRKKSNHIRTWQRGRFYYCTRCNSKSLKKEHNIISNGSCTTNCLAPVAMVLEKTFGINYGYMTTIHSYTGDQKLLDTLHKDLRRARSTEGAMIPTSTGAAKAMSLVLPSLKGKLDGTAIRVPTPNVSLIDFTLVTEKEVTSESINDAMIKAANGELKGVLDINQKPLVSKDFNHNPHSSIFDVTQTQVIKGKFSRVLSWYDNEWGFSNRMCDTAIQIASLI